MTAYNQKQAQQQQMEMQQAMAGQMQNNDEGTNSQQLTEKDKALLDKYKDSDNVDIDEGVLNEE